MRHTTPNHAVFEKFRTTCFSLFVFLVTVVIVIILLFSEEFAWAIVPIVIVGLSFLMAIIIKKRKSMAYRPYSNGRSQQDQTPPYTISPSVPLAPRSPPTLRLHRMSPLRPTIQPIPTTLTTNQPLSQLPLSVPSQLNHFDYSQTSQFPSPFVVSQTRQIPHPRNPIASFPASLEPVSANLQPPSYPEVVEDDPGLPSHPYTTYATDKGSGEVFGPSTDGLPSYEAAMSTWHPFADEAHLRTRDDRPTTND